MYVCGGVCVHLCATVRMCVRICVLHCMDSYLKFNFHSTVQYLKSYQRIFPEFYKFEQLFNSKNLKEISNLSKFVLIMNTFRWTFNTSKLNSFNRNTIMYPIDPCPYMQYNWTISFHSYFIIIFMYTMYICYTFNYVISSPLLYNVPRKCTLYENKIISFVPIS